MRDGRPVIPPESGTLRAFAPESGYGLLLRTVAASLDDSDSDAAQSLRRAGADIEQMVAALPLYREVTERYGNYWCKDDAYYAAAEALGMEEE